MKLNIIIAAFLSATIFTIANGQDSLYAKAIDSSWISTWQGSLFYKKHEKVNGVKFDYEFYKTSNTIRSIISFDKSSQELILFFYLQNKIVMISPVGREPYYILNDKYAYSKEPKHSSEQISNLISRAKKYITQAYGKIKISVH